MPYKENACVSKLCSGMRYSVVGPLLSVTESTMYMINVFIQKLIQNMAMH